MAFLKCIKNSRVIPNGKTALPINDVQILLHCADIWDKEYASIRGLYADADTLLKVTTNDNAIDYFARSWNFSSALPIGYEYCHDFFTSVREYDYCGEQILGNSSHKRSYEIDTSYWQEMFNRKVPYMTSATAPSGEVTADSTYANYYAWYPFRANNTTPWISNHNVAKDAVASGWLQYKFKRKVKIYAFDYTEPSNISQVRTYSVMASDDGVNFDTISLPDGWPTKEYFYWRFEMNAVNEYTSATYIPRITTMQFYGRETGGVFSWMKAANIPLSYSYSTIGLVCADTSLLASLFNSQDACDYLVTAKSFIEQGICDNENFMTALGNSNYASNLLLSDAEWYEAIKSSTYASLVINVTVPKMTGDTTPSGEAYASSYASSYQPWKAFNQSTSSTTCWSWSGTGAVANNAWLAYDFGKAVKIYGVFWQNRTTTQATRPLGTLIVQGSNDKTTWTDVSDTLTGSATASAKFNYHFANSNAYRHYRVLVTSTAVSGDTNLIIQQLQFYGREDV